MTQNTCNSSNKDMWKINTNIYLVFLDYSTRSVLYLNYINDKGTHYMIFVKFLVTNVLLLQVWVQVIDLVEQVVFIQWRCIGVVFTSLTMIWVSEWSAHLVSNMQSACGRDTPTFCVCKSILGMNSSKLHE